MTNKEFWINLFSTNDVALASAIILCERFVNEKQLNSGREYIEHKKKWLYDERWEAVSNGKNV